MHTISISKHNKAYPKQKKQHNTNKFKHTTLLKQANVGTQRMSETYKKEIVQHIIRSLLHIQLLCIIQAKPAWGYHIKKQVDAEFNIKLRHGALYPALNLLE